MSNDSRLEHDAYGPTSSPAGRYWGAQTARALEIFTLGGGVNRCSRPKADPAKVCFPPFGIADLRPDRRLAV